MNHSRSMAHRLLLDEPAPEITQPTPADIAMWRRVLAKIVAKCPLPWSAVEDNFTKNVLAARLQKYDTQQKAKA